MRVAITGGTGFVGRNLSRALVAEGHEVVLIARGLDRSDLTVREHERVTFLGVSLDDTAKLAEAFAGCDAIAHCAGVNRERGTQTFARVHVDGTRHVIQAAHKARAKKILLVSFLRARPACGSGYHESKWAAEELVRESGLDYTIFKSGVIYGRGDHMLDHLSHAFHTFPVFGFVGFIDKPVRPVAVEDFTRLALAALVTDALSCCTLAVVGPEELSLREAVRRVAQVTGRAPVMIPMPLWFHYSLAALVERVMKVPLVSLAQVRMLSEGIAAPCPACDLPPPSLAPRTTFNEAQIRKGLPPPGPFRWADLTFCRTPSGGREP